jgi:hypothetical protein
MLEPPSSASLVGCGTVSGFKWTEGLDLAWLWQGGYEQAQESQRQYHVTISRHAMPAQQDASKRQQRSAAIAFILAAPS